MSASKEDRNLILFFNEQKQAAPLILIINSQNWAATSLVVSSLSNLRFQCSRGYKKVRILVLYVHFQY